MCILWGSNMFEQLPIYTWHLHPVLHLKDGLRIDGVFKKLYIVSDKALAQVLDKKKLHCAIPRKNEG